MGRAEGVRSDVEVKGTGTGDALSALARGEDPATRKNTGRAVAGNNGNHTHLAQCGVSVGAASCSSIFWHQVVVKVRPRESSY
jgi:hypothetical protein